MLEGAQKGSGLAVRDGVGVTACDGAGATTHAGAVLHADGAGLSAMDVMHADTAGAGDTPAYGTGAAIVHGLVTVMHSAADSVMTNDGHSMHDSGQNTHGADVHGTRCALDWCALVSHCNMCLTFAELVLVALHYCYGTLMCANQQPRDGMSLACQSAAQSGGGTQQPLWLPHQLPPSAMLSGRHMRLDTTSECT